MPKPGRRASERLNRCDDASDVTRIYSARTEMLRRRDKWELKLS
jgi:hypothetical protein